MIVAAGRYPLPLYLLAVVLGGIPYFALLAVIGHELKIPPWILLLVVVAIVLVFLFERWRKRGKAGQPS